MGLPRVSAYIKGEQKNLEKMLKEVTIKKSILYHQMGFSPAVPGWFQAGKVESH